MGMGQNIRVFAMYSYLHDTDISKQERQACMKVMNSDECFKDFRVTFNGNKGKQDIDETKDTVRWQLNRTFVSVSGGVLEATSLL